VEDGKLIIEARRERVTNPNYRPGSTDPRFVEFAEITSASLTTQGRADWRFGKIEVRAKLPQGRGVWPAIWMLATNRTTVRWPMCGEIDIMEYVGFEPNVIHGNIHTGKYNHVRGTGKGARVAIEKPFEDFHTYSVEWSDERLDFFADGKKYFTYEEEPNATEETWPFDRPFYLILNLAIGGAWGGQKGIDPAIFPQKYEIDYVRVYTKTD
jgi:beta-glucanase (GH16 family)